MKHILLSSIGFISLVLLQAQSAIQINEYLVNRSGDTLELENILQKGSPLINLVYMSDSSAYMLRVMNEGFHQIEQINEQGWQLLKIGIANQDFQFSNPISLLPTKAKPNRPAFGSVPFTCSLGKGIANYEIIIPGFESAQTPLRNFVDCLKIELHLIFIINKVEVLRYQSIEWYAKGIGLVKFIQNAVSIEENRNMAAALKKAILQGQELEGRKK